MSCSKGESGIEQVNDRLKELGQTEIVRLKKNARPGESGTIWLGTAPNADAEKLFAGLPEPKEQGYRLAVGKDWIVILGKDLPGLYYGLMTLCQLIQPGGYVTAVKISDWPDLSLRGTYIAEPNPEKKIEYFASLKLNFIVFEYPELYHMDDPKTFARWSKIADECRKNFIEPIPELQCLGHGDSVVSIEPRCVEAVYNENVPVTVHGGRIQAAVGNERLSEVSIDNPGFEKEENGKPTGWSVDSSQGEIVVDKSEKHGGESSLRISLPAFGTLRAWTSVPCEDQSCYDLSCYMKTKDIVPKANGHRGAYIEAYGLNEVGGLSPAPLGKTDVLRGSDDWRKLSCRLSTHEYKQLRIYVRIGDGSGTAWFDDVKLKYIKREILTNAIITKAAPLILTDRSKAVKYVEGKDFKVIPGDFSMGKTFFLPGAKPSIVEIIPGGKIKEGDELLLSYNYAPSGAVSCCPSEPLYRNLMRKSIHNAIKCMKCNYLHIGHDEPQAINRDSRCKSRGLSNAEIFLDDVRRMQAYAVEADPKVRVMMWDDALNPYANAHDLGLDKAGPLAPKDVIMCAWAYGYPRDNEKIEKSIDYWTKLGFDITGSPWFDKGNVHYWDRELVEHKKDGHILGGFYTAWMDDRLSTWDGLRTFAQYSWAVDKVPFDEFLGSESK
jgi:hypothetical protein